MSLGRAVRLLLCCRPGLAGSRAGTACRMMTLCRRETRRRTWLSGDTSASDVHQVYEHRVDLGEVHALTVPGAVIVIGVRLGRREAAVEPEIASTRVTEVRRRLQQPGKQPASAAGASEPCHHLFPGGSMQTLRKQASVSERRDHRPNICVVSPSVNSDGSQPAPRGRVQLEHSSPRSSSDPPVSRRHDSQPPARRGRCSS